LEYVRIGRYSPLSATLWEWNEAITWSDETTAIPNDSRYESFNCPFDPDDLKESEKGKLIVYVV
jgi:hypothetical protein